jgi:twitching motility protein PilT
MPENERNAYTPMDIKTILEHAVLRDVKDIFVVAGLPITYKIGNTQERMDRPRMLPADIRVCVDDIYEISGRAKTNLDAGLDDDFSFALYGVGRFRVNVFRQRGSLAAVIRVIRFGLPDPAALGIPESVLSLADNKKGLVLITGAAGAGKSTTLACMIDRINRSRDGHIITMEDPIEYIHRHNKSIVSQREISIDTPGYLSALRSALRESPDVILLGEMRDYDTISAAITAAETGVMLLSTLHTSSAANTISRILDVFPANQQKQVKIQLAQILKGVVCQQLVPSVDGSQLPVFEIMKSTTAIRNMIREDKLHQLESAMQAGAAEEMCTMDGSLLKLYQEGKITRDTALLSCVSYETMDKRLGK